MLFLVIVLFFSMLFVSLDSIIQYSYSATEMRTDKSVLEYPLDAMPYNMTWSDWSADWWRWLMSIPMESNPANDTSGINCAENQNGPVWFLAGSTETGGSIERNCTIPEGKSLLFPIVNSLCTFLDVPTAKNESDLRACAYANASSLKFAVDGTNLKGLHNNWITHSLFNITLSEDNIFGTTKTGDTKGVSAGYYVFLKPLAIGKHVINLYGVDNYAIPGSFSQNVTYFLDIVPKS